jgi:hypothetical protein
MTLWRQGEDTAWVTVDFHVPHASDGDWIGVFSPSNFKYELARFLGVFRFLNYLNL